MKKKTLFLPAFFVLPALLAVGGCSSNQTSSPYQNQTPPAAQQSPQTPPSQMPQSQTPSQQTPSQANTSMVTIENFAFSPSNVTIKKGNTVTWTNKDSATHQIASDTGAFQGSAISQGQTYSFTFNDTGTFPYHCAIHPTMKGTITVQ